MECLTIGSAIFREREGWAELECTEIIQRLLKSAAPLSRLHPVYIVQNDRYLGFVLFRKLTEKEDGEWLEEVNRNYFVKPQPGTRTTTSVEFGDPLMHGFVGGTLRDSLGTFRAHLKS